MYSNQIQSYSNGECRGQLSTTSATRLVPELVCALHSHPPRQVNEICFADSTGPFLFQPLVYAATMESVRTGHCPGEGGRGGGEGEGEEVGRARIILILRIIARR